MPTSPGQIRSPFPQQVNVHVDRARAQLRTWTRDTGLVRADAVALRLEHADCALLAALAFPTAGPVRLELVADWIAWAFLMDDHFDSGRLGRDTRRTRDLCDRMCAVLDHTDADPAPGSPALVSALAHLWSRTATATATTHWRVRFAAHLADGLRTLAGWEAENRVRGIVPDPDTYIEKRRRTGGMYAFMDLIPVVEGVVPPAHVYAAPQFQAALDAACDVVLWTNDLYSLDNERSSGEVHNLVHVLAHHRGLGPQAALTHVRAMITTETEHYLGHEIRLLRAFPEHAATLVPYAAGMRTWMRGNLDWSSRTGRYRPADDSPVHLDPALVETGG